MKRKSELSKADKLFIQNNVDQTAEEIANMTETKIDVVRKFLERTVKTQVKEKKKEEEEEKKSPKREHRNIITKAKRNQKKDLMARKEGWGIVVMTKEASEKIDETRKKNIKGFSNRETRYLTSIFEDE